MSAKAKGSASASAGGKKQESSPAPRKPRKAEDLYVLDAFKAIGKTDEECEPLDFGEVSGA